MANSEKDTENREAIPTKPMSDMDKLMVEQHKLRESKNAERERAKATPAQPTAIRSAEYDRVAQAATEGDPVAQEVMKGIAAALGADNPVYADGRLSFKDPDGKVVTPNWEDFREQGEKVLSISKRMYDYKPSNRATSDSADTVSKGKETQKSNSQEGENAPVTAKATASEHAREAIPTKQKRYSGDIDSIYNKGLPELARGEIVNAALSGDAGNLKTLSAIDTDRKAAPLERDYIRARAEYARSGAMARAAGGSPEANEKWSPLGNGDYLVSEKDSGRPLYAMDANGEYMPARFAGNPEAWREFVYNMNTRLGLERGESYVYTPMGEFVQVVDRKTGKLINVPLKGYMQAMQDSSSRASKSASPNIGSAQHMFYAGQGND